MQYDHQITDEEIFRLIEIGLIWESNLTDGLVYKWHGGWKLFHRLKVQEHPLSGRRRYLISIKERNRLIYANKLLWMIRNRRLVPSGHDIDHKNNDRQDDSRKNLRAVPSDRNRREGYDIQLDKNLQGWIEFFDFIQFMGRPPVDGHPLWQ